MGEADLTDLAARVLGAARNAGTMVTTVESCTGGLLAGTLTAVPGSSDVVDGGTVTYSNAAKVRLGVPEALINTHGAVSEPVARAMAEAGHQAAAGESAMIALAITGVAGPGGGTPAKPVGLVHFAAARADGSVIHREVRFGDLGRDGVRLASVGVALELFLDAL